MDWQHRIGADRKVLVGKPVIAVPRTWMHLRDYRHPSWAYRGWPTRQPASRRS